MDHSLDCPLPADARTDDELVHAVGHGDANQALRTLEQRYAKRLHHFVHGLVRDVHLAADVTQEVLEKAYLKHHLYAPGTSFRAWLFEVARNQALSALRKQRRQPRPVTSLPAREFADAPRDLLDLIPSRRDGQDLEEGELMARLDRAVEALPGRYSEVFRLCIQQGKTYDEAAKRLRIPTGTVAIRIMRARRRLYEMLKSSLGHLRRPPACLQ